MSRVYLSLGSNVDAERNIRSGMAELRAAFPGCRFSPIYRCPAVGFEGEDFLNLAAAIETRLRPEQLRDWLRGLENRHGRDRGRPRFSDRTLDIDILLIDEPVIRDEALGVPRAEILEFAHVLKPLADLAPDLVHPVAGKSLLHLWRESGLDDAGLERIELN